MPSWAVGIVWLSLYWASIIVVPTEKLCKGLFTRYILKKIIPPKRAWNDGRRGHSYRYILWFVVSLALSFTVLSTKDAAWDFLFWGPMIALLLDDYIFGDEDQWKRLWSGVKNTVKWKMDLPPEPIKQETV